jgi:T4 RnlA family RNA ligase
MQVIEFIKRHSTSLHDLDEGLSALTEQLAISVKKVDDLLVLNYNQIDSPKTNPIVMECRSLILEAGTLRVVSRSFDRFFNYGEALNVMPVIDWSKAVTYDKVDGSLIKIYRHKGRWNVSTKGTAYGESDCMGYGVTFKELVLKALGCDTDSRFQLLMNQSLLHFHNTYIFELTSVENRVVKRYEGYNLHFLAARNNETGEYETEYEREWLVDESCPLSKLIQQPKEYRFDTVEECLRTSRELKDLDEGYVVYQDGVPIAKVKSPTYVAVHHIRGEGLNPKRVMQLVLSGEHHEYLNYFPDDEVVIMPYVNAYLKLTDAIGDSYDEIKGISEQKEFAVVAQKHPFKAALFQARAKNMCAIHAFNDQRDSYKMEILKEYV